DAIKTISRWPAETAESSLIPLPIKALERNLCIEVFVWRFHVPAVHKQNVGCIRVDITVIVVLEGSVFPSRKDLNRALGNVGRAICWPFPHGPALVHVLHVLDFNPGCCTAHD